MDCVLPFTRCTGLANGLVDHGPSCDAPEFDIHGRDTCEWVITTQHTLHWPKDLVSKAYYFAIVSNIESTNHWWLIPSANGRQFGYPSRAIRMPSRMPLQRSWSKTRGTSTWPGCLYLLGTMHRMKCGCVAHSWVMRLNSCSLCHCPTVWKTLLHPALTSYHGDLQVRMYEHNHCVLW